MNQKASLVSLAVDKAWADAANAEEAKNNYLENLIRLPPTADFYLFFHQKRQIFVFVCLTLQGLH